MKISERLACKTPLFSFEFFPPKTPEGVERLFETLRELKSLSPAFVSVTYGAGGSTRTMTVDLVRRIKQTLAIEAMAHLTCIGSDKGEINRILHQLEDAGIKNILALRGDPLKEGAADVSGRNEFTYAFELVAYLRNHFQFSLGGACYPEGHIECRDLQKDLEHLKKKVDAGLDFVITQLFFENRHFHDFQERAHKAGISIPIIPGIMPITNLQQVQRFTEMCGASLPKTLLSALEAASRDDVLRLGIHHAVMQCRDLLAEGVPGIHFYTLNQSTATQAVVRALL